mmetsp:Transcript_4424/g.11236  ORF Transcript_4424/g.11236 Transcript_4424/m.11236 type:complete len:432 (-) Transcript_4424:718-2013(-)
MGLDVVFAPAAAAELLGSIVDALAVLGSQSSRQLCVGVDDGFLGLAVQSHPLHRIGVPCGRGLFHALSGALRLARQATARLELLPDEVGRFGEDVLKLVVPPHPHGLHQPRHPNHRARYAATRRPPAAAKEVLSEQHVRRQVLGVGGNDGAEPHRRAAGPLEAREAQVKDTSPAMHPGHRGRRPRDQAAAPDNPRRVAREIAAQVAPEAVLVSLGVVLADGVLLAEQHPVTRGAIDAVHHAAARWSAVCGCTNALLLVGQQRGILVSERGFERHRLLLPPRRWVLRCSAEDRPVQTVAPLVAAVVAVRRRHLKAGGGGGWVDEGGVAGVADVYAVFGKHPLQPVRRLHLGNLALSLGDSELGGDLEELGCGRRVRSGAPAILEAVGRVEDGQRMPRVGRRGVACQRQLHVRREALAALVTVTQIKHGLGRP